MIKVIITKTIPIKWCPANKIYFESKGYKFTKFSDVFDVKVEDLKPRSSVDVEVKCDVCGNIKKTRYSTYTKSVESKGHYECTTCNIHKTKYSVKDIEKSLKERGFELVDAMGYKKCMIKSK